MHQNPVTTVVAVQALREENHRKANHCIPHVNGEHGQIKSIKVND